MKLLHKDFRDKVTVKPETSEDLWNLKHILREGDVVGARTLRTIQSTAEKEKKMFYLKLAIEKMEFSDDGQAFRLTGKIVEGPDDVQHGYHTISAELHETLDIFKKWKASEKRTLEESLTYKGLKALIVVCDEREADFAVATELHVKEKMSVRAKGLGKGYGTATSPDDYYNEIIKLMELELPNVNKIILAGPGFTKENIYKLLPSDMKGKVMLYSASVTGKTGLNEVVKRGGLKELFKESKMAEESALVEDFLEKLARNSRKVTYGYAHVSKAVDAGAVEKLLVSDKLMREEKIEALMEKAEEMGGIVHIINSTHESGEQLYNLTGVAAFLRYNTE